MKKYRIITVNLYPNFISNLSLFFVRGILDNAVKNEFVEDYMPEICRWLTVQKGVGIGLVLVGVVCLITRGQVEALLGIRFAVGDLWMLAAALIFAVFSILLKRKPEGISVFTMQFSSFVLGLLFLSPFFCWEQVHGAGNYLSRTTIPAILYIGIFA